MNPTAISANTFQYPAISCGKSCGRKVVLIWLIISNEVEKSALRKNIQQKQTKWNVMSTPKKRRTPWLSSPFFRPVSAIQNLCAASATPWNNPQTTKFHEAPCHNPPRNIVIMRLAYWRIFPFRFPPKEI